LTRNKLQTTDVQMTSYLCMKHGHEDRSVQINGFECYNVYRRYQNRRAKRSSGGVVLYIRNS